MKKTLFFAVLLSTSFGFGQKRLLSITSRNYDETNSLVYADSSAYIYTGSQGALSELKAKFQFQYSLFEIGTPEDEDIFLVHSDQVKSYTGATYPLSLSQTTNNVITSGKITTSTTAGSFRTVYSYNTQGQPTMRLIQFYNGSTWESQDSTAYTYDAMGNKTTIQSFDASNNYEPFGVDSMFYNAGTDKINKYVSYYYDSSISSFVLTDKSLITYSGANVQTVDLYTDNGLGSVEWYLRVNYTYTSATPTGFNAFLVVVGIPSPSVYANGIFTQNAQNQITQYSLILEGDSLFTYQFEYDADGYLSKRTDSEADNSNNMYVYNRKFYTYDNTTSIAELKRIEVGIFPNPIQNTFTIETDEDVQSVQLVSLSGQVLLKQNSKTVDISHLPSGSYILQGNSTNGVFSKKIVKL